MLSIGLIFFVKEIWNDFQAGKTNDRVYSESKSYFQHPTIAICFEPQINENLLKLRYNKTLKDLSIDNFESSMKDVNVSVKTLLDEVSFKLGKDFSLYLMLSSHESNQNYLFKLVNSANTDLVLQVEEMPSEHYGACTIVRISDELKGSIKLKNEIRIIFKTDDESELPLVNVFFTSKENFHGAALLQWTEGEVYALAIDPKQKMDYAVKLKQQIRKRLTDKSNCNPNGGYYKCFADR